VRSDGLFSKSDPFWSISKRRPDGVWVQVAKSGTLHTHPHARARARMHQTEQGSPLLCPHVHAEVVMNDLNPTWKALEIDLQHLCNGDMHRELKLEIMHKEKDDKSIESASAQAPVACACACACCARVLHVACA
jgi:hypothetical protein